MYKYNIYERKGQNTGDVINFQHFFNIRWIVMKESSIYLYISCKIDNPNHNKKEQQQHPNRKYRIP